MKIEPSDFRVDYGKGEHAVFRDRARAEKAAVDLHGLLVPLYDLRSEEDKAAALAYLEERARQL